MSDLRRSLCLMSEAKGTAFFRHSSNGCCPLSRFSSSPPRDYVFTRADGRPVRDPRKAWYDLCVRSGFGKRIPAEGKKSKFCRYKGLNLHDFRRSFAKNSLRFGIPEKVCMDIGDWKTRAVFDRYNIVDERDLIRASRLIEAGRQHCTSEPETDTKTDTSHHRIS